MDKKGQGALEYLLLIGGAVLVAVIVITLLLGIADQGQTDTQATADAGAIKICESRLMTLCNDHYTTPTEKAAYLTTVKGVCTTNTATVICPT